MRGLHEGLQGLERRLTAKATAIASGQHIKKLNIFNSYSV